MVASVPELTKRTISTEGKVGDHPLGQPHLELGGRAEGRAPRRGLADGRQHRRVGVAQDQRAPGEHQVDVAVAVHVLQPGALAPGDEAGRPADAAERAHRAVHPAGQHELDRLGEQPLRGSWSRAPTRFLSPPAPPPPATAPPPGHGT